MSTSGLSYRGIVHGMILACPPVDLALEGLYMVGYWYIHQWISALTVLLLPAK